MDNILLINACVRPSSRTLELAETLLKRLKGNVQEVRPHEISLSALDLSGMENRNQAVQAKADITAEDTDHSIP